MKKKALVPLALFLAGFLVVAAILTLAESGNPEASIQGYGDAVWYLVVTLTTVGYGDYYPITSVGKVIGAVAVFSSLGLMAFIIARVVSLFNSDILPIMVLKRKAKKPWYVFSELNAKTMVLLRDIRQKEPDSVILCLSKASDYKDEEVFSANLSYEKILDMKKEDWSGLHLFFLKETHNDYLNFTEAFSVYKKYLDGQVIPFHCYCLTEYTPETIPVNLTCFQPYENVARLYWLKYPILAQNEVIVLIGTGKYGSELLKQALQGNVIHPVQHVQYHVFGKGENFQVQHHCLSAYFGINQEEEDRDCIFFHEEDWRKNRDLLEKADRIIFCEDVENRNLKNICELRKYFLYKSPENLHVLSASDMDDMVSFGADAQVYTKDMVVRSKLNQIAKTMNDLYVRSSSTSAPDWNHLSEFKRQSNIAVADHVPYKLKLLGASSGQEVGNKYEGLEEETKEFCRRLEHERWSRFHIVNNWKYNPVRNDAVRQHPCLARFEELSLEEQKKDDYSWMILKDIDYSLEEK